MKSLNFSVTFSLIFGVIALGVGCSNSASDGNSQPATSENHEHDHDHGDGDGDGKDHSVEGHGHGAGPHDGTVADWGGGKYHVEFTVDHDKQEGTVYILGGDEKTPSPIKTTEITLSIKDPMMQVTLKATPQEGDPEGTASKFVGTNEGLGVVQEYEGTISGVIDDTPYSGDFKEVAHDHE
jgi:hypothetical protein